ncbi:response regulator [Halalkalibacter urbisdiaboli]|uniref:response regulator n=1 Tax=Halalkalibacter urbisdiaboli TaxID=1960589 RepID=UPI000B4489DE|nr:response regulator [Halalkalibacter urbisdiaboli]
MNKVVIVDDEMFVRKGIINLIDWNKLGYEVVGEADNGEDAIKIINDLKPDVVITDIRMPVVDGLELIKKVKKMNEHINFIIISGYNDFSYAQQAVRYGVFDFILKPVDKEEFEEVLENLADYIMKEKKQQLKSENALAETMFTSLLGNQFNESDIVRWSSLLNVTDSTALYYCICEVNNVFPEDDIEKLKQTLSETVQFVIGENQQLLFEQEKNIYGLLITPKHLKAFQGNIKILVDRIQDSLLRKLPKPITLYVSECFLGLPSLKQGYDTASLLRKYKFIFCEGKPLYYESLKKIQLSYSEMNHELYQALMEQIEEGRTTEIIQTVEGIFAKFKDDHVSNEAVVTSINRCIYGIIQTITSMSDKEETISQNIITQWESCNLTPTYLKKLFTDFVLEGSSIIHNLRKNNLKGDIHKIKTYVELNYDQNISLKSIAKKYYMNPVYMGQLFKKTFGVYFKEFLLTKRIEEAKKLLRKTDLRVYEVAQKVGFGSTDYFVTQFEKMTKMTPTEYRNQLLNQ